MVVVCVEPLLCGVQTAVSLCMSAFERRLLHRNLNGLYDFKNAGLKNCDTSWRGPQTSVKFFTLPIVERMPSEGVIAQYMLGACPHSACFHCISLSAVAIDYWQGRNVEAI